MTPKQKNSREGLRNLSRKSGDVAEYYDEWAEDYDETLALWQYEAPDQAASRLSDGLEPGSSIVLDAGCGTGLTGKALANAGFAAIDGIDVSRHSLEVAARLGVYRSLEHADMQELPLPCEDNSYDGLVCVGVLTYVPDSAGILREFCRVLRPGGRMVLTQRSDLMRERDFPAQLSALEREGVLSEVNISDPSPYLPENEEFGDQVLVHYVTCRAS